MSTRSARARRTVSGEGSAATQAELRSLRLRVTALISLLAAVVVVMFAVVAVGLDRRLRDEQLDADLLARLNEAAAEITFVDDVFEPGDLAGGDLIVGVRPAFDPLAIADDQDLWSELPDPTQAELDDRVDEIVAEFDRDDLLELLDVDDGAEDDLETDELRAELRDERGDELYDEALRGFVVDGVAERDLDFELETDLFPAQLPLDDDLALGAVELVADLGENEVFDLGELFEVEDARIARGVVLRSGAETRGALVAVVDPAASNADHAAFRRSLAVLGAVLVLGAAAAAWWVAGRTIRPVAAALGQQERFLSDAAHELRTPIAAIRATAESPGGDSAHALARVVELAEGAGALTDDLLTLARMDAERLTLQREPVRLDLLVEALVDDAPDVVVEATAGIVEVDPALLNRAIGNLITNARLHGGASVATPVRVVVGDGIVRVADRGPGIDRDSRVDVFDRFRSRAGSSGHGLGLPLARWIAEAHNGSLTIVESEQPGAVFELRLPTQADRAKG